MSWVLVYTSLDHGDPWAVPLTSHTRTIALKETVRELAILEAARVWAKLLQDEPFPRKSNPTMRYEEPLPEGIIAWAQTQLPSPTT